MTNEPHAPLQDYPLSHDEAELLMPFFVNGSLRGAELAAVEVHIRNCVACRRELGPERAMVAAFQSSDPLTAMAAQGLARLTARIEAPKLLTSHPYAPPIRALRKRRHRPHWERLATSAVATFAMVALTAVWSKTERNVQVNPPDGYRTLAAREALNPAEQNSLQVIFRADIRLAEVRALLDSLAFEVVRGPNTHGAFDIRPRAGGRSPQVALAWLRARPEVVFVEPNRGIDGVPP